MAVDRVSFRVAAGSLFCLLGPNGAGKTTTVSILTTTLAPTSGTVRVAGHDVLREQAAVRAVLGVVFQQPSLDLHLTAEENVRLHAVLYGLYPWRPFHRWMPARYRRQVDELASMLGVADVLGRPVRTLSGGTRRKLEIVRALLHRPAVLVLDEPTTGLDPEARRSLWQHLDDVRLRLGTTILLTTHYLHEAETADRVCVLWEGRVLADAPPASLKLSVGRPELWLDARDRQALRAELVGQGCRVIGEGPFSVPLEGRTAQETVKALQTDLTLLSLREPTLEDAYIALLERARA
jgi:ABC-2 type transport system ATP-binding protein